MPKETVASRAAFRAGVKGMRYTENPDPGFDVPVATDTVPGPNERHFETIERLPGLSDPEAAYETGRALRMIGHILDSQTSPVEHGRHFLSQLANAVMSFALRGERQPWGAEDTAFVFRGSLQGRTPGRPKGVRRHPGLRAQTADRQSEVAPASCQPGIAPLSPASLSLPRRWHQILQYIRHREPKVARIINPRELFRLSLLGGIELGAYHLHRQLKSLNGIDSASVPNPLIADAHDLVRAIKIHPVWEHLRLANHHGDFPAASLQLPGRDLHPNILQLHGFRRINLAPPG